MALLDIKKAGNPVLKKISVDLPRIDKRTRRLLDDMAETMYAASGIGLAAPQIGKSIRAVVIDVGDGLLELINPVITSREGKAVDTEGCLSVPKLQGEVERSEKVEVDFLNRYGKRHHLAADGLLARCIQHELDHLDGQLFIDIARNLHEVKDEDKTEKEKR